MVFLSISFIHLFIHFAIRVSLTSKEDNVTCQVPRCQARGEKMYIWVFFLQWAFMVEQPIFWPLLASHQSFIDFNISVQCSERGTTGPRGL